MKKFFLKSFLNPKLILGIQVIISGSLIICNYWFVAALFMSFCVFPAILMVDVSRNRSKIYGKKHRHPCIIIDPTSDTRERIVNDIAMEQPVEESIALDFNESSYVVISAKDTKGLDYILKDIETSVVYSL